MKAKRSILLTLLMTITVFSVVVYTACNKKSQCDNVLCKNEGVCYGGNCVCKPGFEGIRCETLSRDKFIFTYNGGDLCRDTTAYNRYPIHLLAIPYDSLTMTMKNLLNDPDDSAICTIRATDSFTFIGSNNSTTYQGTGKLSNDSLWLHYRVTRDTASYACMYFGESLR